MSKERWVSLKTISNLPRITQTVTDRMKNESRLVWCESLLFTLLVPSCLFSELLVTENLVLVKAV